MLHQPPEQDESGVPNATATLLNLNMAFKVTMEDF
jgi:hypothetical protein